jgi:uncharacterized membrane protein YqiK
MGLEDAGAARARAEMGDRRIAELEAQNAALRDQLGAKNRRDPRTGLWIMAFVLALAGGGLLALPQLVHVPPGAVPAVYGAGALAVVLAVMTAVMILLVVKVPPGRIAVLSGRPRMVGDRSIGYRIVTTRAVRVPFVEAVTELDISPFPVELSVESCHFASGDIGRLEIEATLRVAADEPRVFDAIERFLGRTRDEIATVCRDSIESCARALAAAHPLETLRDARADANAELLSRVGSDLYRLGIEVDALRITHVVPRGAAKRV